MDAKRALREYYVAVGHVDAKVATLVELLAALGQGRSVAVACSSRDSLDEVTSALVESQLFDVLALHSDLTEQEREHQILAFKREAARRLDADGAEAAAAAVASGSGAAPLQSCVLAVTDVCLKAASNQTCSKELLPMQVPLLVQYDLPAKKETYQRRISSIFGGGKERRKQRSIIIDFVVAGEMEQFRALELFASPGLAGIKEMPVHVPDIFTT